MYAAAYVIAEDLWFASFIVICVKSADANCKKLKKLCLITILCSRKIIFNVEKWHQMSKSRFLQRDIFHNDLLDYSLGSMRSPKTFITDVFFSVLNVCLFTKCSAPSGTLCTQVKKCMQVKPQHG